VARRVRPNVMGMGVRDEDLVAAFQGGDAAAFDVLVRRWERKIQGAIYRMMRSEEEARDLCQETFLKAFRGLGNFRGQAKFSSWLYQIALNLCRDRIRRKKGKTWVSLDEIGAAEATPRAPSVLDLVEVGDLSRRVAAAMGHLPEEQREAVILKEYEGMTFPEIATVLGVPVSTVKTRLYRGLSQLRRQLERQGVRGGTSAAAPPA
jgi:RNA polymerase sigma-70 factor, ECF subfamily